MPTVLSDIRYGFRMLLAARSTTAFAIIILALAIGGTTALFSPQAD